MTLFGLLLTTTNLTTTQVVSSSSSTTSACGSLQFGLFSLTACLCWGPGFTYVCMYVCMYECTYVRSMFGFGAHACAPISHLQWHLTVIIMKFIYDFGFLFTFPALARSLFLSPSGVFFLFHFVAYYLLFVFCCWFVFLYCCCCVTLEIYFVPRLNVSFVQFTLQNWSYTQSSRRSLPAVAFRRRIPCGIRSAECSACNACKWEEEIY